MESTPNVQPDPSSLGNPFTAAWLLDTLPWAVLVLDEQRRIRRVNQQAARWLSTSPEALPGQPLAEAALPPAVSATLLQLLEPGQAAPHEVFLPQAEQWLALTATHQPGGWVVYGQDITPQKQREQQYQALADNTPDALTRWTPDLRLRYANAAFAAGAGAPLDKLLGRTSHELSQPAGQAGPYQAALQRVFDTGQPQEHFHQLPTPQGAAYYYSRLVPELRDGEIETVLGIARNVTALRQAEQQALRLHEELAQRATDKYHTLFYTMSQGFCLLEVLFEETGQQAVDYRYLELNPVFAEQSGLPADAQGKTIRELMPDVEPFWFDTFGRVARTGEAVRLEHYLPQLGRWFDVHAFRVGAPAAGQVAVLFTDITARRHAEEQLRQAAAAAAFRLQLADALGPLTDPVRMQEAMTHLARLHFGADRCYYCELEDGQAIIRRDAATEGLPSLAGTYPLADFALLQAVREAGRPCRVRDVRQDDTVDENLRQLCGQLRVISYLNVPVVKNGQPAGVLCLVQSAPREWTTAEVALAEEAAERTWAAVERARTEAALAASEAKYRTLFETMDQGYCLMELVLAGGGEVVDLIYHDANAAFAQQVGFGDVVGKRASEVFPRIEQQWVASLTRVQQTGVPERVEGYNADTAHWFTLQYSHVGGPGSPFVAAVFTDITERKRREANAALLSEVSEDLAQLTSTDETMRALCEKIGRYFGAGVCAFSPVDDAAGTVAVQYVWHRPGAVSPAGVYRLDAYHSAAVQQAMRAGQPEVVRDTAAGPPDTAAQLAALQIGAFVNLPLVLEGVWCFILSITAGAPRDWRADELAVMRELTGRIWTRLARARAEEALAASEAKYRTLFESTDAGVSTVEALFDAQNQVVDYRILEVNPAHEVLCGRGRGVVGQRIREVLPPIDEAVIERVGHVVRTGEPLRFEEYVSALDRWFDTFLSRVGGAGSPTVVSIFSDITARKRHENHAAFLDALSQALAGLGRPDEIVRATGEHLSAYLGVSLLNFCEVALAAEDEPAEARVTVTFAWERTKIPNLRSSYRAGDYLSSEFLRAARAGEAIVVCDTDPDPRVNAGAYRAIGMRAFVAVPVLNDGAWPGLLSAFVASPRNWRADEVDLLVEVGHRVFPRLERARAEAALRASEERFRIAEEASNGFVYDWNPRTDAVTRSAGYYQVLGYGPGEVGDTATAWQALLHPSYQAVAQRLVAPAGGPTVVNEYRVRRQDGTYAYVLDRSLVFRDEAGQVVRLVGSVVDISARRRAEKALQASEAKYRTLFETMDQGFGVAELLPGAGPGGTTDFRWLEINPQVERLTGMPQAALLSGDTMRTVMPQLEDILYEQYDRVARTGEPMRFEQYAQVLGRWFDVYVYALEGPASSRIALLFTNISARKQAEEALRHAQESHRAELEQQVATRTRELRESRDLLHAIAESQSAYVNAFKAIRDESGRIVDLEFIFVNSITTRVDGGHPLVGRRYLEAFPEAENSGLLDTFRRVIETGIGEDQEIFYDDGQLTGWFRNNATPLNDGVLAIGEDITPRKQAEQERLSNLRLLEQAEAVAGLGSWDYELATGALRWSAGMYALFGWPQGRAVAPAAYLEVVVAEDRARAEEVVRRLTSDAGTFEETLRLHLRGAVKTVRIKSVVFHDEQGQAVRILGVDLDITELQRLEADNLRLRLSQQQALFEAVQAAQEAERRIIAEGLHNGIGQILYATKLRLDQLPALMPDATPDLVTVRRAADQLLSEAIRQTRVLSHELVPLTLEQFGLPIALQNIGRNMNTPQLRFTCQVLLDEDAALLSAPLQLALYRMAQELAQNIVKHARGATQASLELETMPGWVLLRAEDNGPGFATPPIPTASLGLRSIRDRVALLGGAMETGTRTPTGAYVRIRIPLPTT